MKILDKFKYQLLNYQTYHQELNKLLNNEKLINLGLEKITLFYTDYGYPYDLITIGKGPKELILVGGTHGSEHISTDFLLNFIRTLPDIPELDPAQFKLVIIPLQNPEGFDISSNTLKIIPTETTTRQAYEYYLRYRTDAIITAALDQLNQQFQLLSYIPNLSINEYCLILKYFILTNPAWKKLDTTKAMPKIKIFNQQIINLQLNQITNYQELQTYLIGACNYTLAQLNSHNIHDQFLLLFMNIIKNNLTKVDLWRPIKNEEQLKLYQQMFENSSFQGLHNPKLTQDITNIYHQWQHPKGSQIGHDATGTGINLNANTPLNRGIAAIQNNQTIYGPFVKNNIKNYTPGPLGIPTKDVINFQFTKENLCLEELIKISLQHDNYLATLLFHGTGGQIFYKPYQPIMPSERYTKFAKYNEVIAQIYSQATNYQLLANSDTSGYGDYLRRNYPGVLLIELSKMGGNPIGPYGDENNIYNVFQDNSKAIANLLNHFSKKLTKK